MTHEEILSALKLKRNIVINALTAHFCTKNYDLKDIMNGYLEYLQEGTRCNPNTLASEKRIFKSVDAYYSKVEHKYTRNVQGCADALANQTYRGLNLIK